jgi:hypothetical protein
MVIESMKSQKELLYALECGHSARISGTHLLLRINNTKILEGAYLMIEAYEMMETLQNLPALIEDKYFIFLNQKNSEPVVFPKKDFYHDVEFEKILEQCGV